MATAAKSSADRQRLRAVPRADRDGALGRGRNAMAIWQDLVDQHGFPARYASVVGSGRSGPCFPEAPAVVKGREAREVGSSTPSGASEWTSQRVDLVELLRRPEGKTIEFKRDLSTPDGVLLAPRHLAERDL